MKLDQAHGALSALVPQSTAPNHPRKSGVAGEKEVKAYAGQVLPEA